MSKQHFFGRFHSTPTTHVFCRTPLARSLRCELLEDRRMLAQLSVTTDQDIIDLNDGETSLREAVFAANIVPGADEIVFDFGHDGPTTIMLTQGELLISDSLRINGAGAQLLTIDASGSDPTPDVNNGDGSRAFKIDDGVSSTLLAVAIEGLTITGGDTATSGGGISNRENLTLREVAVKGNSMSGVRQYGGGVFSTVGTLEVIDSQIIGNSTPNYAGGGIAVDNGTLFVSTSRIAENQADLRSGGIDASSSTVTITDTLIEENSADGPGGGLSISQGTFLMQRSTVRGNSSTHEGGGLSLSTEQGTIVDSAIVSNTATVSGGGIRALTRDGLVSISQSTISQNQAPNGSALLTYASNATGRVEVRHSTLSSNHALDTDGAAVLAIRGKLVINHSIVAGNAQESRPEFELAVPAFPTSVAPSLDVHYSLIGDSAGTNLGTAPVGSPDAKGNIIGGGDLGAINPLLGPLADNGGPTPTHALLPSSPAINAGLSSPDNFPEFDQRGEPHKRVFGGRIDLGAYERQSFVVDTLVDESDKNFGPGDLSLREAIQLANLNSGADTIEFSPQIAGGTFMLKIGSLQIRDAVQIVGLGAEQLTVDNSLTQGAIFDVDNLTNNTSIEVGLSGLTLTGSKQSAIRSLENLTVDSLVIRGNEGQHAGGILVELNGDQALGAKLTVRNSLLEDNHTTFSRLASAGGILFNGRFGELTIEDSTFNGNSSSTNGGGLGVGGFSNLVNITDSKFFENEAVRGGGIFISDDNATMATLTRVQLRENTATQAGGGGYFTGKSITILDSEISGNRTTSVGPASQNGGGGIFKSGGDPFTIERTRIAENQSATSGGGILLQSSSLVMSDSTIDSNSATREGGGLFGTNNPNINIARSTISNNTAAVSGGGVSVSGKGSMTLRDSTVNNNSSQGSGGGVQAFSVDLLVSNSTISGNSAGSFGGGLSIRNNPSAIIAHSTITNNRANSDGEGEGRGGGIYGPSPNPFILSHSIVASNFVLSGTAPDIFGNLNSKFSVISTNAGTMLAEAPVGSPDANGNLIGGPTHGSIFALLGPLADNGGPTLTHALFPGSPAIDAGELATASGINGIPEFDQRGEPFTRVFGDAVDIGAFEVQTLVVDTLADELDDVYSTGDFTLREAIDLANRIVGSNTIVFSPTLAGGTIRMTLGEYAITDAVEIVGLGAELLTIDAQHQSRIFNLSAPRADVLLSGLWLTGGRTTGEGNSFSGGVIRSSTARLTINNSIITGNSTWGSGARGGAIYSLSSLQLSSCEISNNYTLGNNAPGGAIYASGGVMSDSNIENNRTYGTNSAGGAAAGGSGRGGGWQIAGSTLSGNKTFGTASRGGALAISGGLSVTNSSFHGNATYGLQAVGGAISSTGFANLLIDSSSLTGNAANNGSGGALFSQSQATIRDSVFSSNRSAGNAAGGGAIHQDSPLLNIIRSKLTDNEVIGESAAGGAIRSLGQVVVVQSEISGNRVVGQSTRGGGLASQGPATITDSTISGNRIIGTGGQGGGAFVMNNGTVINSTISGNEITGSQAVGGGVFSNAALNIRHSTVTANRVSGPNGKGGGVWFGQSSSSMFHSIIAANFVGVTASDLAGSNIAQTQLSYSLIGTNAGTTLAEAPVGSPNANGNLIGGPINGVIDPFLGSLADNGGPTKTHSLLPSSPAINAGIPSAVPGANEVPEFDQRGVLFARIADGRVDIGAFESQPTIGSLHGDFDGDGDVDGRDFLIWQRGSGRIKGATRDDGDATGDGDVDSNDLAVWQETYGEEQVVADLGLEIVESEELSAPRIVSSLSRSLTVSRYETASGDDSAFADRYVEQVDHAFEQWTPLRRSSVDFGDIVTHRHVRRRDMAATSYSDLWSIPGRNWASMG